MAVFDWNLDANPLTDQKPRVNNIKFGDGYEQRVAHGINNNPENWSISFTNREETEALEIDAFFKTHGGVTAFDWTPPGASEALKFKCQEWTKVKHNGNLYSLTAKFEQVFDP